MEEAMEVRSAIQQIVLEHRRRYGYRRVSAELRRQGMLVNHKRVARIMREDDLLALQPKRVVRLFLQRNQARPECLLANLGFSDHVGRKPLCTYLPSRARMMAHQAK